MRIRIATIFASLLILHCAPKPSEKIDLSKTRTSLMLTDGSSVSTAAYDEYNPILVARSDGQLVLIFASDRPCGGCTAGDHNLFAAVSAGTYDGDREIPPFSPPVVIKPDGSNPANSAGRLRFVAEGAGPAVVIAFEYSGSISFFQLPEANQASGVGINLVPIGNTTRTTDTLLGFGPEPGSMLTRDGTGVTRYSAITQPHNGRAVANAAYDGADTITRLSPLNTLMNGATFTAEGGTLKIGNLYADFGIHEAFDDALNEAGLYLMTVQQFDAGGFEDLLLFSAHDGGSEDLYVVDSHTVGGLWALEGVYGFFDDSAELRNMWQVLPATLPALRGGMAAAAYGSKAYLFGGTADGSTANNTIYEFDMVSETFTNCGGSCATWPTALHGATAIESGGLIYVVGGSTTTGAAGTVNTIRSYNPSNQAITLLATMPVSRQIASLAVAAGKIYTMGGASVTTDCVGGTSWGCSTNYSYNIAGNSWSGALAAVTHPFSGGAAAAFGDSIFAFGGFVNGSSTETNAVGEYSVTGNTWPDCGGSCPTLTTGRYSIQAVTYGQYAYIIGGANQGGTSFDTIEEFDMLSKTFTACNGGCAAMPLARNVGSAVLYNGQIYYFGGNNAGPYVNTVFKYFP